MPTAAGAAPPDVAPSDVVRAARAVVPIVAEGRAWAEVHARLAPAVVEALGGAGMFRLTAPREAGGWEAPLPDQLVVHEALGAADPSAAWCVTNAAVAGRAAAYLDDDARAQLFAAPSASYAFSNLVAGRATPVEGGYLVSGCWSVVSGAAHAEWAVLGARLDRAVTVPPRIDTDIDTDTDTDTDDTIDDAVAGEPGEVRWMLVPASCWSVEPSWEDAGAMRGSGSHTLRVAGTHVPEAFAHSWERPLRIERPLYRLRYTSVTGTATAAISLGVLRGATEHLTATLSTYRSSLDGASPRDWPNVQLAVAELTAARRAAWSGLRAAADDVWAAATAEPGADVPPAMRAALFAAADHAVQVALAGVSRAYVCGTAQVLRRGHPLDLALRDVHGMAVNWERIRRMVFDAGGVLLGREPRHRAM